MRELIGYISLPDYPAGNNYIRENIIPDLVFDRIIDGCHSECGELSIADDIENKFNFYLMQCYYYLWHKYGNSMKLRFWLEKDKWDWRIACEVLA